MKITFLSAIVAFLTMFGVAPAQSVSTTTQFTYTITITPVIASIQPANGGATTPPSNANTVLATMVCVTNPVGGTCVGPVTLGGADAGKFSLTNGGMFPTSLAIGAVNVPAGTYSLTATASQ